MSYLAHVRIVNEIEYSNGIGNTEYGPEELLKELKQLEDKYDKDIIIWQTDVSDDIELHYNNFKKIGIKEFNNFSKELKKIYENSMHSESSLKNGYIRIDWF